jgi:hypothetical protein
MAEAAAEGNDDSPAVRAALERNVSNAAIGVTLVRHVMLFFDF